MYDAMNQRHSYVSIFSVTIKTGELLKDVKRKIIPTENLKCSNAFSSAITVRIGYLLMRDSQLVIASKYNPIHVHLHLLFVRRLCAFINLKGNSGFNNLSSRLSFLYSTESWTTKEFTF